MDDFRDETWARIERAWSARPRGGTDRERQAWANGFREALESLGVYPEGGPLLLEDADTVEPEGR